MKTILVSACLLGVECNYKGLSSSSSAAGLFPFFSKMARQGWFIIPVCPEQLGGLSTPRIPAEIIFDNGVRKVIRADGVDVTDAFMKGANETLRIAKTLGANAAIFKSKSPSCGVYMVYDGTFSGNAIQGQGVCADLLRKHGLRLRNDKDLLDALSSDVKLDRVLSWV